MKTMKTAKTGRNDSCPCGSNKKYKNCCEGKEAGKANAFSKWAAVILGCLVVLGALGLFSSLINSDPPTAAPPGKVWSPEHGHYH